jgi:hypothetical protein
LGGRNQSLRSLLKRRGDVYRDYLTSPALGLLPRST